MNSRRRIRHPLKLLCGEPTVVGVPWERARAEDCASVFCSAGGGSWPISAVSAVMASGRWVRLCGKLFASAIEECIDADNQCACPQLSQGCEDRIEVAFGTGVQDMELHSKDAGRRLQVSQKELGQPSTKAGRSRRPLESASTRQRATNRKSVRGGARSRP
jgi:hypothetical protein